jgi:hypothetical protein
MRQTLHVVSIAALSVFSIETVVGIIDWFGRWDWLTTQTATHPRVAAALHTPFTYVGLLFVGFFFLFVEGKLREAKIVARYTNSKLIPNLHTTTMKALFDCEQKKPGWDDQKLDWYWFVELQLANDSDFPTTLEDIEVRLKAGKKVAVTKVLKEFKSFVMEQKSTGEHPTYEKVPDLMQKLSGVPLTRGIGHRGWIGFSVEQVNQKDINNHPDLEVWLVDALKRKHKVIYEKKCEASWEPVEIIED